MLNKRVGREVYRWLSRSFPVAVQGRCPRSIPAVVALAGVFFCTPSGADPGGYAALVRRAAPSVVTILVEEAPVAAGQLAASRAIARDYDSIQSAIQRLLSGVNRDQSRDDGATASLGSGFVVRADGMIVTNRHVILGARKVHVHLPDGRDVTADIVGADALTDIALLRVHAGNLPALRLGSSEDVAVGDAVIAIGNPFGLGQSVSAGIVSARARALEDDPYINFLQTDAAINRGNSGGPLLSTSGSVVGVTSVIFSPSGGSVGLGFAIPAETVSAVIRQLEAHGRVERGYLGISAQELTPEVATALHVKAAGHALITGLDPQGPSTQSLAIGDVLLSINLASATFKTLSTITARLVPNSLATIRIARDGKEQSLAIKVARLPDPPVDAAASGGQDSWVPALGLGLADTTSAIRDAIKANNEPSGLIVTQLRSAGPGALAGLKVGDLVTHVGTKQLIAIADLGVIHAPTRQAPLLLRVVREGSPAFVAVTGEAEMSLVPH
ncbi:MAG TPA: trypsin-like peptidase domain-containing protein [Steroidobacteraceae bacterium]|nr:trypsin-like peptidase domain-containing protein [Steroidobacteraceae bacterium]